MHQITVPPRCITSLQTHTIAISLFEFLTPAVSSRSNTGIRGYNRDKKGSSVAKLNHGELATVFYNSLFYISTCALHRARKRQRRQQWKYNHVSVAAFSSKATLSLRLQNVHAADLGFAQKIQQKSRFRPIPSLDKEPDPGGTNNYHIRSATDSAASDEFFSSHAQRFAVQSRLPQEFFNDVTNLQNTISNFETSSNGQDGSVVTSSSPEDGGSDLREQIQLLESVRSLEAKLSKAKADLQRATQMTTSATNPESPRTNMSTPTVTLSKDDFVGLVDLYYYTHKHRFTPESPSSSPTPLFEKYSFKLSEDFASPEAYMDFYDIKPEESPLRKIEEMLKSRQIREISVMKAFVDLLLDDKSSNKALFEIYKKLPSPGVAYLPKGMIRVFLQRMSTPWTKSEKSMLRYLSLIDDMQKAGMPITQGEWSSAIHLAGRSFAQVTEGDLASAFRLWRKMEQDADVQASHVTFNILFDIAVRAGKFVLAERVLGEMHDRGLKLNRLGRVNLIYYHGLRGDGDGVRKTYRDFVEAGEIVDTLVLNCVIASLINAQEPAAAEQVYERMKNMQIRLHKANSADSSDGLYLRYPPPGSDQIGGEMASNALGRVLSRAPRLKSLLPEHHEHLQNIMPLTPDHTTFRSMISYHANKSGDLDRLTVLLNDMTELFSLPFTSVTFQLLFKGFALHGVSKSPNSSWNVNRLNLVWDSCREAVKEAQWARKTDQSIEQQRPVLPSVDQLKAIDKEIVTRVVKNISASSQIPKKLKRLSSWDNFVLDLAAFPGERRKPIERVHAQLFDDEPVHDRKAGFTSPFFHKFSTNSHFGQQTYYPAGENTFDHEEGEYTLPTPTRSIRASETAISDTENNSTLGSDEKSDNREHIFHEVRINRPLICWLLRAYTRCTGSSAKVEEIWNSARKLWRPSDEIERDSVLRVLRRCLRDCERFGPHI